MNMSYGRLSYTVIASLLRRPALNFRLFSTSISQLKRAQSPIYQNFLRKYKSSWTCNNLLQFSPSSFIAARAMSSNPIKNIDIKEYLSQRENQNVTIIDVREKSEIAETGILPGGVNIPVGEIADALQKDETNFKQLYSINKPSQDDPIIFSCRSGKRSMMASETAKKLGYNNIMNLSGGWMAWEQHSK